LTAVLLVAAAAGYFAWAKRKTKSGQDDGSSYYGG
jgi:hypothetical protein